MQIQWPLATVIGFISETHITYDINTFSSTVKESTSFRLRAVNFPSKRDSNWLSNSKSETIVPKSLLRPELDGQSTFRAIRAQHNSRTSCYVLDSWCSRAVHVDGLFTFTQMEIYKSTTELGL